jgi:methylmalonyl-CoA mutase
MENPDFLFSEFPPVRKEQWKQVAQKELKTLPYESILEWEVVPDMLIESYYDKVETTLLGQDAHLLPTALELGVARNWANQPRIAINSNVKQANQKALSALNAGADGVLFVLPDSPDALSAQDFAVLLQDILLPYCQVSFWSEKQASTYLPLYLDFVAKQEIAPNDLQGAFFSCPIQSADFWQLAATQWVEKIATYPHFKSLGMIAESRQEPSHFLATLLAHVHNILKQQPVLHTQLAFHVPLGDNYFLGMAVLRVLRRLAYSLIQLCTAQPLVAAQAAQLYIHAQTVLNPNEEDTHTNLIRNTTQAMTAILGGANALTVLPHHPTDAKHQEMADRVARNVSLVLQEEAYLGKVNDPLAGSYFLETLTEKLAQRTWQEFQTTTNNQL